MPIPGTVTVTGPIGRTSVTDTYATHDTSTGKGGWQSVANLTARDAIFADCRYQGMSVWVISENKMYVLQTGLTNADWVEFSGGGTSFLWDGAIPFSTFYSSINGSSLTYGVQVFLKGIGHTIDNKGSIYTNIDKIAFVSFDTDRTVNIANGTTIDKMPYLVEGVVLQSQSTSFACTNPSDFQVGRSCAIQSDNTVLNVKFLSLSGLSASCTIKLFGGSILGENVFSATTGSHLQIEMYESSYIDPRFLSGNSNLIISYQSNVSVPLRSEFVNFTGSIIYVPVNNANELTNSTNVLWDGNFTWSDFYIKQNVQSLQSTLTNYLKSTGHTIDNKGSVYSNMDNISYASWDSQKIIDISQGATFLALPILISGVNLRSKSTSAIITNPASTLKIGIDCILSTDTGARFINLTGSSSCLCVVNGGAITGSRVFDLAGTSSLSITLLNKSSIDASSIYGIVGTTLNISYSADSTVPLKSNFSNFLGTINYTQIDESSKIAGGALQLPTLSAIVNRTEPVFVGQLAVDQSNGNLYRYATINNPPGTPHVVVQIAAGGGSVSGTLTPKKIPVATGTAILGDSILTQDNISNISCGGYLDNNTIGNLRGSGDEFYFDKTVIRGISAQNDIELKTATATPSGLSELTLSTYATSGTSPVFMAAFLCPDSTNNYYGIKAGVSAGKIWTAASDLTGVTELVQHIMRRTTTTGVVTMSGSGTTRTVTATQSIFFPSDYNADITKTTYLYTPVGIYPLTSYSSPTSVQIQVPAGYVNETNAAITKIVYVYNYTTGNILTDTIREKTFFSDPNTEFTATTGVNWTPPDQVVIFIWAKTTVTTTNKIDLVVNGKTRYSHIEIPNLIQIKSVPITAETNVSYFTRRSRTISGTGSFNFNFSVPQDFRMLLSAHLFAFPSAAAAGTGRSLSKTVNYTNNFGDSYNIFSATENSTYDLTGYTDKRFHIQFNNILTNIRPGSEGGLTINHTSMAGNVEYPNGELIYI